MGRYKVLEAIGEGSFGKVFRGECKETQQVVALKFIPKHLKGDKELISLRRECEIQRGLFHPNIVLMLDSFETEREIVAVSEYVPKQLCALLHANGCMTEKIVCSIACNLVSALYYLHSHRIVHRDIKPQNILLTEGGVAKLCDFGFSKKMEINTYVLESIKGTPLYMAPELIEQQPYDQKADLWSLGCILFELLTGKPPFCTNSIVHLIEMVRNKPVLWPTGCSSSCLSFLKGLLQKDQDKRLEWPDVLKHPWVSMGINVVPHNPRVATLTTPLTESQQQIKEHQKQQVVKRNMAQPNLLNKALARKILNDARIATDIETVKLNTHDEKLLSEAAGGQATAFTQRTPENICSSLEKMSLSVGTTGTGKQNNEDQERREGTQLINQKDSSMSQPKTKSKTSDDPNSVNILLNESTRPSNTTVGETSTRQANSNAEKTLQFDSQLLKRAGLVAEESEIEEDEWCHFLNQTIADVMGGNFDAYTQPGELAMFVTPLRHTSCPLAVLEKIAAFFMLPFVLKPADISEITNSYFKHKVVCNLIFACKHIKKSWTDTVNEAIELDKEQINALNQILMVICHLIHLDSPLDGSFLSQLCEAMCVLDCYKMLGRTLLCPASSSQLLSSILAILSQILRIEDSTAGLDLGNIVMQVINSALPSLEADEDSTEDSLRVLLMSLLTHTAYLVRSRTSTLLGYVTMRRSSVVSRALTGQHKLLCDLINLENDPNREVCRAASFALTKLQQHTSLLQQPV